MIIPVHLSEGDEGVLDTMVPSRQGLLLVLLDGRVILCLLTYEQAQITHEAWSQGRVTELKVGGRYVTFHRTAMH